MTSWRELKKGDRIRLIDMPNDPDPVPPGTEGTVLNVNDVHSRGMHQISVDWDNGSRLCLIEIDKWEKVDG